MIRPDLHEFIRRFNGYAAVTAEGWAEWDRLNAAWQQSRRDQVCRELEIRSSKRRAPPVPPTRKTSTRFAATLRHSARRAIRRNTSKRTHRHER